MKEKTNYALFDDSSCQEFLFYCWSVLTGELTKHQLKKLLFDEYNFVEIKFKASYDEGGSFTIDFKTANNISRNKILFQNANNRTIQHYDYRQAIDPDKKSKKVDVKAISNIKYKCQKYMENRIILEQQAKKIPLKPIIKQDLKPGDSGDATIGNITSIVESKPKVRIALEDAKRISLSEITSIIEKICKYAVINKWTYNELKTYLWCEYLIETGTKLMLSKQINSDGDIECSISLKLPYDDYLRFRNYSTTINITDYSKEPVLEPITHSLKEVSKFTSGRS